VDKSVGTACTNWVLPFLCGSDTRRAAVVGDVKYVVSA
jgi:hypothetical protein